MFEIRKLFRRNAAPFVQTGMDVGEATVEELQDEFRACILDVLGRAMINKACVDIEIRHGGQLRDGRHLLTGMLRLVKWERVSGLRLLIGLPILERGVRRLVAASWAAEAAHFGGLWMHPSGQILERPLLKELGHDLTTLENAPAFVHLDDSAWSGHSDGEPVRKATDWAAL
jgi:hypothetical protein